jgi:hypothetical protein
MSPPGSGVLARDRTKHLTFAFRSALALRSPKGEGRSRVPLDTGGLQAMRLKRLVGRLCQTPGEWDVGTPDQVRSHHPRAPRAA